MFKTFLAERYPRNFFAHFHKTLFLDICWFFLPAQKHKNTEVERTAERKKSHFAWIQGENYDIIIH